jgi:hypothetical protein
MCGCEAVLLLILLGVWSLVAGTILPIALGIAFIASLRLIGGLTWHPENIPKDGRLKALVLGAAFVLLGFGPSAVFGFLVMILPSLFAFAIGMVLAEMLKNVPNVSLIGNRAISAATRSLHANFFAGEFGFGSVRRNARTLSAAVMSGWTMRVINAIGGLTRMLNRLSFSQDNRRYGLHNGRLSVVTASM